MLFALSSVALWAHWFRTNRRRYMLTLTISMVCESDSLRYSSPWPEPRADATRFAGMTLGFLFRLIYRSNYTSLGLYIIQYMFVLLSPCAFLAMDCESRMSPIRHALAAFAKLSIDAPHHSQTCFSPGSHSQWETKPFTASSCRPPRSPSSLSGATSSHLRSRPPAADYRPQRRRPPSGSGPK